MLDNNFEMYLFNYCLWNICYFNLLNIDLEEQEKDKNSIDGPTVVIYGLDLIVPLMSTEMLKVSF